MGYANQAENRKCKLEVIAMNEQNKNQKNNQQNQQNNQQNQQNNQQNQNRNSR